MTAGAPGPAGDRRILRVSELVEGLRDLLEHSVGRVWVAGEISNLHRAPSGHSYFTLKDDAGQMRAALFRGAARRLRFDPEDGLEVVVHAEVSIYAPRGDLQLIVQHLEPLGQGALQLAFEQLRAKLEAEGLFDAERKRALPAYPRGVGVVTSPRGAAVRDVIHVSGRRMPGTPILLAPTRVQGEGAEQEVAAALAALDARPEIDVILLVRGGGSLEDLWTFNSEVVARALAACATPVITGVGHETDFTIADLVADARAATPSAAAALALPDGEALADRLDRDARRLWAGLRRHHDRARARLRHGRAALWGHAPRARLRLRRERLGALGRALERETRALHERAGARWRGLAARLDDLSPLAVLGRGYAIARAADGTLVRRADVLAPGDALSVQVAQGSLETEVKIVHRGEASEPDADRS